jgi:hypothetical protein
MIKFLLPKLNPIIVVNPPHNNRFMNIKITFYFSFLLLFAFALSSNKSSAQALETNYREGEMLVQLRGGVTPEDFLRQHPGMVILDTVADVWNIYLVGFNHLKRSESSVQSELARSPIINEFQRNHKVELRAAFPDDPQFGTLWGLHNTGQNSGKVDADIDAPEAWEITKGGLTSAGDTIVVAVVDDGFQLNHPDLDHWVNHGEIPGNGIDDDGNGYVDDVFGWNAYNNNGSISARQHGTHVAGTIGAKGNNTLGVVGVNWNVKIMAIQGSSGNEATVVRAYSYAFKQRKLYDETGGQKGAFVVSTNASFGVDNGKPSNFPLWCAIYDSLGSIGILSAGATANQDYNIDNTGDIPTACPSEWLISVTNTTRTDVKTQYAGYGKKTIDLGAPGTSINSTVPTNSYTSLSGTSMATPHVAGTIALMWAAACPELLDLYKQKPAEVAKQMKKLLLDNVDKLNALQNITVSGGRLNAHKALLGVIGLCDTQQPLVALADTVCKQTAFKLAADPFWLNKEVYWYQDPTQGHIHVGDTLTVTGIMQNETFYAANRDLSSNSISSKVPVPVVVSIPQVNVVSDTAIYKIGGQAQLWATGGTTYSWLPVTGLSNPNIANPKAQPEATTTYVVTVTNRYQCSESASVKVTVINNTGVLENPHYNSVKAYPVPSKSQVVFEFSRNIADTEKASISVYDVQGRMVDSQNISGNLFIFNRKNLVPGLYWYKINSQGAMEGQTGKIIFID